MRRKHLACLGGERRHPAPWCPRPRRAVRRAPRASSPTSLLERRTRRDVDAVVAASSYAGTASTIGHRPGGRHHPGLPKTRPRQQVRVLGCGALAAARADEHLEVEQHSGMRRRALGQHQLDQQPACRSARSRCGRCAGSSATRSSSQSWMIGLEQVGVAALGHRLEERAAGHGAPRGTRPRLRESGRRRRPPTGRSNSTPLRVGGLCEHCGEQRAVARRRRRRSACGR